MLQAQRESHVDGVLALGDRPGPTAAYVARGLGIIHNHPASVEACRNKLRMREVFRDAGLPVPWFRSVALHPAPGARAAGHFVSLRAEAAFAFRKPGCRARKQSRRISCWGNPPEAICSNHRKFAPPANLISISMLVEGYIPGREVAVEGLLTEGELRILAIFDKPDPLEGPYFEETIYVTPSRLPGREQQAIEKSLLDAVRALGLTHGPVHAEFRINDEGVWPIEVAPRPIGGLCAQALRFNISGTAEVIGLEELLLRHALELPGASAEREAAASGVMMIPVPQERNSGKGDGEEEASRRARNHGTGNHRAAARLHRCLAGRFKLSWISVCRAEDPASVEARLRQAHAKLHFTFTPRLPVEHPLAGKSGTRSE